MDIIVIVCSVLTLAFIVFLFKNHIDTSNSLQSTLNSGLEQSANQLINHLKQQSEYLNQRVQSLTETTDARLKEISGSVEKRLSEGFEKTNAVFADMTKRLALIDEAQKKITQLSSNVVSLQEVLADKRARGAFGEIQLNTLLQNVLPQNHYELQYSLSNSKRVDCMLFLPPPTGNIAIDAKFPLENYNLMSDIHNSDEVRKKAEAQFKRDVIKHIQVIAEKYIIPDETADGAMMFIPAEAVFAEIHAHHPDVVETAQRAKVWLVSPTTMMAILTTARAVIKDAATRKQIHIIQEHLNYLAKDFSRFESRMTQLAKHIEQAHDDVQKVHTSAKKLTSRFHKIEQVDIGDEAPQRLDTPEEIN